MMLKFTLAAAAAYLVLLAPATAQTLTPQEARADLDTLYQGLQEAHFDLFASTPRAVLDGRYQRLHDQLSEPVSEVELHRAFQRFTALARHAHARVEGFNPGFSAHVDAGGLIFPLDIRIREGAVIIIGAPEGSGLFPGDEIIALNGQPNAIWLSQLTRNIAAETPELAYIQLERILPYIVWLEYGPQDTFQLSVQGARGARDVAVPALDYESYMAIPMVGSRPDLSGRAADLISPDIAYLRPGGFYNLEATTAVEYFDPAATRRYVEFINTAFAEFIEAGADSLILDLRENGGGDRSYSDPVIAWFADEPFRFYSDFRLRVSAQTTASNAARLEGREPSEAGISGVYAELFANHENGDIVSFEFDYTQPHDQRFEGEVYVLIDQTSFSNAATTAALIQDYGFGVIAGETTTDMATTYGAMEHFYLPHSGFQIGYPKAHIIRPNGEERPHPVTPDIEIIAPVMGGDGDPVLEQLIGLIEAR